MDYDNVEYYEVNENENGFSAGAEEFFQSYDIQEVYDEGDGVNRDLQDIINLCERAERCADYYQWVLEDMWSVTDTIYSISEIAESLMNSNRLRGDANAD